MNETKKPYMCFPQTSLDKQRRWIRENLLEVLLYPFILYLG
jgi:hypothetical protein